MSIKQPKILCLFSAPLVALDGTPLDALDMKQERDAIVRELASCKREISLRIAIATIDELARSIEEGFNILYVSCHGLEESLLFEDGKGGSQPVTGDYLKKLIRLGAFELAIVNACYSEKIGAVLVDAGIPHVVTVRSDVYVLDHAAIVFVGRFFRSLFQGNSVQKAFEMATLLVEGNPDLMRMKHRLKFAAYKRKEQFVPEEKKFVLLPGGSTSHLGPLLSQSIPHGTVTIEEPIPTESNLPIKPQSFTGRSVEMHDVITELLTNRIVTITGAGGIGKTTLAIEVARWFSVRAHFPDGIYYVDLRQTDTAESVIDLLGAALEVQFSELKDVIDYLQNRTYLLLFDNAEDILWKDEYAMQDIINSILRFTPHTKLLMTSQRPVGQNLHEPERVYRIYSLEQHDAASLFCATTKRRILQREWESETFHNMLTQLGGHPLSIVLTACQLAPGITLEDVLERITVYKAKAIKIKDITDRDLEHGESLIASLASAHHMLSDKAKTLFELLSMLPAGAQKDTLTKIYGDTAWEYVQEVNEASLAEIRRGRATLLPPVRLFAMSIITKEVKEYYGPEIVEVLGAYAQELYKHEITTDAKAYRFYFTLEEPNLRFAVDLPCSPSQTAKERSALGLLGSSLIYLYIFHNRYREAKEVGEKILSNLKRLQDRLGEAYALIALGVLALRKSGNLEEAQKRYEEALTIYQDTNVSLGEANALWSLGEISMRLGNLKEARAQYEKALEIYRSIDVKLGEANALLRLGVLAFQTGSLNEALKKYEEAVSIYQLIDAKQGEANTFRALGDLAMQAGNLKEARAQYGKALAIYQFIESKEGESRTLARLAQCAVLTDDRDHAETSLDTAIALSREIEDLEEQADLHLAKALVFLKRHNIVKAKKELDFCSSIQDRISAHAEAAQWLLLFATHFRLHDFKEGAKVCLEYAEEFASTAQNQYLLNQVNQWLS